LTLTGLLMEGLIQLILIGRVMYLSVFIRLQPIACPLTRESGVNTNNSRAFTFACGCKGGSPCGGKIGAPGRKSLDAQARGPDRKFGLLQLAHVHLNLFDVLVLLSG
jgi:hypothetical protein